MAKKFCYYNYKVGGARFRLKKTALKHSRKGNGRITKICEWPNGSLGRLSGSTRKRTKKRKRKSLGDCGCTTGEG